MIKITPEQFNSILNSSNSITRTVERIIAVDTKFESGSWYAIKASENLSVEHNNLLQQFENLRKTFNNATLSELQNKLIQLEDKLDNYKVNSFVKAIGRQFMMAEKRDLIEIINLKSIIKEIPSLNDYKGFLKNHKTEKMNLE